MMTIPFLFSTDNQEPLPDGNQSLPDPVRLSRHACWDKDLFATEIVPCLGAHTHFNGASTTSYQLETWRLALRHSPHLCLPLTQETLPLPLNACSLFTSSKRSGRKAGSGAERT